MTEESELTNRRAPLLFIDESNGDSGLGGINNNLDSSTQKNHNKTGLNLGTFNGVFMPCVSSMLSAVLFLRLSWTVGEAGWTNVLVMFAIGTFVNFMTALSLAAISTNGLMKGGGAYFMISRSIGPEFGVAMGIMYMIALSVGAAFSLTAFAENVSDSILCVDETPALCSKFHETHESTCFLISSVTLLFLTCLIAIAGPVMDKLNAFFTGVVLASIAVGCLALLTSHGPAELSMEHFASNAGAKYTDGHDPDTSDDGYQTFLTVFVIIFPAMTGVMAGANYSGDLRDPGSSIGKGTLSAIIFTSAMYCGLILLFGACFDRHSLQSNKAIFQESCFWPAMVMLGIMACTISSALGSLVGASRVLQAVGKDELVAGLHHFSRGVGKSQEPLVALVACWVVSQLCLLYGKLDALAAIITDCFLLVYFFLNIACFALTITGAPNFRPRFAYFSWHTALSGAIAAVLLMFVASPLNAILAVSATLSFAYYIHITAPAVPWGDVTQAMIYHQVRKYLLRLDDRRSHPKFWRPSILLVPFYESGQLALLDFCNSLKKGGLYIIGTVVVHDQGVKHRMMPGVSQTCSRIKRLWVELLEVSHLKGFHELLMGSSLPSAFRSLVMSAGLGGLRPNTVCIQMFMHQQPNPVTQNIDEDITSYTSSFEYESFANQHRVGEDIIKEMHLLENSLSGDMESKSEDDRMVEYCEILLDCLLMERNLLIADHFHKLDKSIMVDFKRRRRLARAHSSRAVLFRRTLRLNNQLDLESDLESPMSRADSEENLDRYTTIDLWSTDETDWENPCGTLALQMQLAFGLHRTDVWEDHTKLRVIAACQSVVGEDLDLVQRNAQRAYETLKSLLKAIRVEAEILVLPSVGAALFANHNDGDFETPSRSRETEPLTQVEHCAELNAMVMEHSSDKACVVFLPLPQPPKYEGLTSQTAREYLDNLRVLTQGLPPVILCAPGSNIAPMVTTEL